MISPMTPLNMIFPIAAEPLDIFAMRRSMSDFYGHPMIPRFGEHLIMSDGMADHREAGPEEEA